MCKPPEPNASVIGVTPIPDELRAVHQDLVQHQERMAGLSIRLESMALQLQDIKKRIHSNLDTMSVKKEDIDSPETDESSFDPNPLFTFSCRMVRMIYPEQDIQDPSIQLGGYEFLSGQDYFKVLLRQPSEGVVIFLPMLPNRTEKSSEIEKIIIKNFISKFVFKYKLATARTGLGCRNLVALETQT